MGSTEASVRRLIRSHVVDARPNLNRRFIRRWAAAFAEALDSPEILENLESLFRRGRQRPRHLD